MHSFVTMLCVRVCVCADKRCDTALLFMENTAAQFSSHLKLSILFILVFGLSYPTQTPAETHLFGQLMQFTFQIELQFFFERMAVPLKAAECSRNN